MNLASLLPGKHVRVFPAAEVTSVNPAEADPAAAGLTREDVEAMWSSVLGLYRTGLQPAIALAVRCRGHLVLDRAIGHLIGNGAEDPPGAPKVPIRHDSLFNIYSASKAITAMLVHLLDERGLVHLDDPVAEYLPEFGRKGKEWVTVRHILTHRAGIPAVPNTPLDLDLIGDEKRIFELLCNTAPVSVPGRRLAYHALTGGYVLSQLIERISGLPLRDFLRREILDPLRFSHFNYGVRSDEVNLVARNSYTGAPALPPYSWMLERSLGIDIEGAVRMSNEARFLTAVIPSGNIIGTAEEASRFFELLLHEGELDGLRIFEGRTVRRATAEQSYLEVDSFLGVPVRYGMGFMLGNSWFSLYGADTARAFGHIGFTTVAAWADPERQISVGLMTSGKPFVTPGQLAWINIARTIARRCPPVAAR